MIKLKDELKFLRFVFKHKAGRFVLIVALAITALYLLSLRLVPEKITYGVSFSKFHADELNLDWKETYLAILDNLGVRHLRLSAHWPMLEPQEGEFNFSELDFQISEAEKRGADIILAIGRRLPGWPECHEPEWVQNQKSNIPWPSATAGSGAGKNQNDPLRPQSEASKLKFQNDQVLSYVKAVVEHYKDIPAIKYWQVENEVFLTFFSRANCGELDSSFLDEEIAMVKKLDPTRSVLITDSGEFGDWFRAYKRSDVFGTSMYLYIWNRKIGPFRYPITPGFFRLKRNLTEWIWGQKPSLIIELSTEPWLIQPIVTAPINVLQDRMGVDKFEEMIKFAQKSSFDLQYLWGAEWWYWMKKQGYPTHWEMAKSLFVNN